MTQMSDTPNMPEVPATSVGFLTNLIGLDVTFRLAGSDRGSWGPYMLLAVYPDGPMPAILVKGSKEYLVPLRQITVIHEGAKPKKVPSWQQEHEHGEFHEHGVPVPGMPGIQIEDTDDDENDV